MAKDVALRSTGSQVAVESEKNPFEEYGDEGFQSSIVGTRLKFNKGEWLAGKEEEAVALGTRLVAAMQWLQVGWVKWWEGQPVKTILGLKGEKMPDGTWKKFIPPDRSTLGDLDKEDWEELNGQKRDPWQRCDYLLLADPNTGDIYTFMPSSKGGRDAVIDLSKIYGTNIRIEPNAIPVVALKSESYKHKEFGKVYKPVLELVEWVDADEVNFKPEDDAEAEEAAVAAKPAAKKKTAVKPTEQRSKPVRPAHTAKGNSAGARARPF